MKVYLAARYGRREELCDYARWLETAGASVTSTWLSGKHETPPGPPLVEGDSLDENATVMRAQWAQEDVRQIGSADVFVAFTEGQDTDARRGGQHVELGYALALRKAVLLVGPRENVFCCLPQVKAFADWHEASSHLAHLLFSEALGRPQALERAS